MNNKKKFLKFLRKEGLLHKFANNLKNPNWIDSQNKDLNKSLTLTEYLKTKGSPTLYFVNAFDWGNSPEKYSFWIDAHLKWLKVLEKKTLRG